MEMNKDESLRRYGLYAEIPQDVFDEDPHGYRQKTIEELCKKVMEGLLKDGVIEVIEQNDVPSESFWYGSPLFVTVIGVKIQVKMPDKKEEQPNGNQET